VQDERWELLSPRARRARLQDALNALDVIARLGHERQCLREHTAYTYPTSVGEWLAHAVQLAGGAIWQAPFIALLLPDAHEAGYPPLHSHRALTRTQGADSALTFGAALWSAVLEVRDAWHDDEQRATCSMRSARRATVSRAQSKRSVTRSLSSRPTSSAAATRPASRSRHASRMLLGGCARRSPARTRCCSPACPTRRLTDRPDRRRVDTGGRPRAAPADHALRDRRTRARAALVASADRFRRRS